MKDFNKISKYCFAFLAALLVQSPAQGQQILVSDTGGGSGHVNEYTLSGQGIATPLVPTENDLQAIAVSGNVLYTADFYDGTIGEYNIATRQPINSSYIAASQGSYGIAVANNLVYVSNYYGGLTAYTETATPTEAWTAGGGGDVVVSGTNLFVLVGGSSSTDPIREYNALTGAPENMTLVGLDDTFGLAISGNDLFVSSSYGGGTIGEYTTAGVPVNPSLVTGVPDRADGLAVVNGTIYVTDISKVEMYSVATGDLIGTISGLFDADDVVVVPEPSTWVLLLGGLGLLAFWRTRRTV
jgi:hypothetical protein